MAHAQHVVIDSKSMYCLVHSRTLAVFHSSEVEDCITRLVSWGVDELHLEDSSRDLDVLASAVVRNGIKVIRPASVLAGQGNGAAERQNARLREFVRRA